MLFGGHFDDLVCSIDVLLLLTAREYSDATYQKKFAIYGRLNDIFQYCRALKTALLADSSRSRNVAIID